MFSNETQKYLSPDPWTHVVRCSKEYVCCLPSKANKLKQNCQTDIHTQRDTGEVIPLCVSLLVENNTITKQEYLNTEALTNFLNLEK